MSFVRGISNSKEITETKADVNEEVIKKFYIINPGEFIYNPRTTRMGEKAGLGYNNTNSPLLFTFNNIAFAIKAEAKNVLLPDYLYIYFNRSEFDRYAMSHSWGSATELFTFDEMCNIAIDLPSLPVQQKYVDIYKAMVANQQSYEHGLDDLILSITAFVEKETKTHKQEKINTYHLGEIITQRREKYDGSAIPIRGVSRDGFIEPKQPDADLSMYNLYYMNDFVFNPARMELNSIALNVYFEKACCSSLYEIFYISKPDVVLPEYLDILLKRTEFARWCEYVGWGSAREYCRVDTISQYPIGLPSIDKQVSIVKMYNAYKIRKNVSKQLSQQIKDICPILIKGSLEEGKQ